MTELEELQDAYDNFSRLYEEFIKRINRRSFKTIKEDEENRARIKQILFICAGEVKN